jgi:Cd2+/Zn2+-exporting ATPase
MIDSERSGKNWLVDHLIYLDIILVVLFIFGLIADTFHLFPTNQTIEFLAILSILGTLPVIGSALRALIRRRLTIDLLASIALVFALFAKAWYSAVFINLMIASARIFDRYTTAKAKNIIKKLLKGRPLEAKIQLDRTTKIIPIEDVRIGDLIVIESGDQIPVDGIVTSGQAAINQATITGESEPVIKRIGDPVYSATMNESGSLIIKADKVGEDTTLAKIVKLVDLASRSKTKEEGIANKFTTWYIILTLFGSVAIYFTTRNLNLVLSLLLVICADDIAVSIPLSFTTAIAKAAREGMIVKGATTFEAAAKIKTMVTDKTGTLTRGKPQVTSVEPIDLNEEDFLEYLAMAETYSKHPTARAIIDYIKIKNLPIILPESFNETPGEGICVKHKETNICAGKIDYLKRRGVAIIPECEKVSNIARSAGGSVTFLGVNKKFAGVIFLEDQLRPFARAIVKNTKELGVERWILLTGDNEQVAQKVATEVNVDAFHANLKPEDKVRIINNLRKQYGTIAMVGDGVNDAAALAAADLSIAMGAIGSDAAIEAADIALMSDNLRSIPRLMNLSNLTLKIVNQNFWIWGITNALGISLVLMGGLGPIGASVFNFITDFIPIMNSLRIISVRLKHREI